MDCWLSLALLAKHTLILVFLGCGKRPKAYTSWICSLLFWETELEGIKDVEGTGPDRVFNFLEQRFSEGPVMIFLWWGHQKILLSKFFLEHVARYFHLAAPAVVERLTARGSWNWKTVGIPAPEEHGIGYFLCSLQNCCRHFSNLPFVAKVEPSMCSFIQWLFVSSEPQNCN